MNGETCWTYFSMNGILTVLQNKYFRLSPWDVFWEITFWPSFVKRTWVPLKECKKLTLSLSLKKPLVQATSWICLSSFYFSPLLGLTLSQCVSLYSWKYNNFHKCISHSVQWIFRTLQPLSKRDFFSSEKIGSKGPKWKLRRQRWERNFQLFEGS